MVLRTAILSGLLLASLSGCDDKPTVIDVRPRDTPEVTEALKKPVVLPPSISASKQYRCSDNTLAFVDFYSDARSASVRTDAKGAATRVSAERAGDPMTGGGYVLKGGKDDAKVTFTSPTHKAQTCHV